MKLSNRNIFALLAASASLLTSCSDDVLYRDGEQGKDEKGVFLYLPDIPEDATPVTGTRGDGQLIGFTRSETTFDDRRLFVYEVNSDGSVSEDPIEIDIKSQTPERTGAGWARYKLEIPTGTFKMYVTANIDLPETVKRSELLAKNIALPANLDKGLPMSCSPAEMDVTYDDGTTAVGQDIVVAPGAENISITAKMKYCVAKVRVTTLNDIRPSDLVNSVSVTGHLSSSSLYPGYRDSKEKENAFKATGAYTVTSGKYYQGADINSSKVSDSNVEVENLGAVFTPAAGNVQPYTYQAVFYVPERLFQTSGDMTTVNVNVGGTTTPILVGAPDENGGTQKIVKRSHFYDYVGASDGKFYLQVQQWDPEIIAGAIHGNSWLEVDKTAISVSAGFETRIAYKASGDITPDCNEYNHQKIYTFDKKDGNLIITINKEIDREEFNTIKAGDDWKYFTITCGTIVKKIEVANFDFTEYILDDTMVTIDVNERKQSGRYSNTIPVSLSSNVRFISFEKVGWPSEADEGTPASLILQDMDGNAITPGESIAVPENGNIDFQIAYNDLNSDRDLWKNDYDMQVVVYALDKNGNKITSDDGQQVKCNVGVYVRTSYDVYRIHFKGTGWTHPHIFVYQCLTLPGDLVTETLAKPSQVVGHNKDYAALEYDFTGGVAFKGWYVGEYNNPTAPGNTDPNTNYNHFWVFNDGTSWDPNNSNDFDKHYYHMDFAKAHRDKIRTGNNGGTYCSTCTDGVPMNWPGIHMLPDEDNDGWWYFELTGVADPGKALVMFTDLPNQQWQGHNYDYNVDENKRYPKKEQPGVALFDYPTKEGWFEYQTSGNLAFQSEKPGTSGGGGGDTHPQTTSTFEVGTTYAILFNTSATVWCWTTNSSGGTVEEVSKTKGQNWPGSNYNRTYTFTPTKAGGTTVKVKYNSVENNEHATPVSSFKWNATTQRYEATINP